MREVDEYYRDLVRQAAAGLLVVAVTVAGVVAGVVLIVKTLA